MPDRTLPGGALAFIAVTQAAEYLMTELLNDTDIEVGHELFEKAQDYLGISESDLDDLRQRVAAAIEGETH